MSRLIEGRLRSRRYVRTILKQSCMGWDFERGMYNRVQYCFHNKVQFYSQPYSYQAICGLWAYLPVECVQQKHRGKGKTYG